MNLLILLTLFIPFQRGTGQTYIAPDGNPYTNHCEGVVHPSTGNYWQGWFNDGDGDCKSDDWVIRLFNPDDTPKLPYFEARTQNPRYEIDFNAADWGCCDLVYNSPLDEQSCRWSISVSSTGVVTFTVDCSLNIF